MPVILGRARSGWTCRRGRPMPLPQAVAAGEGTAEGVKAWPGAMEDAAGPSGSLQAAETASGQPGPLKACIAGGQNQQCHNRNLNDTGDKRRRDCAQDPYCHEMNGEKDAEQPDRP